MISIFIHVKNARYDDGTLSRVFSQFCQEIYDYYFRVMASIQFFYYPSIFTIANWGSEDSTSYRAMYVSKYAMDEKKFDVLVL